MSEDNKWICKDGILHHGELIESSNNFDIIECFECGFKHVTPIPTNDELEEIYSHDYYTTEKPFYIEHYLEDKEWWDIVYTDRYEIFEKHVYTFVRNTVNSLRGQSEKYLLTMI